MRASAGHSFYVRTYTCVRDVAFLGGNAAISGWPFTDAQPRGADAERTRVTAIS